MRSAQQSVRTLCLLPNKACRFALGEWRVPPAPLCSEDGAPRPRRVPDKIHPRTTLRRFPEEPCKTLVP